MDNPSSSPDIIEIDEEKIGPKIVIKKRQAARKSFNPAAKHRNTNNSAVSSSDSNNTRLPFPPVLPSLSEPSASPPVNPNIVVESVHSLAVPKTKQSHTSSTGAVSSQFGAPSAAGAKQLMVQNNNNNDDDDDEIEVLDELPPRVAKVAQQPTAQTTIITTQSNSLRQSAGAVVKNGLGASTANRLRQRQGSSQYQQQRAVSRDPRTQGQQQKRVVIEQGASDAWMTEFRRTYGDHLAYVTEKQRGTPAGAESSRMQTLSRNGSTYSVSSGDQMIHQAHAGRMESIQQTVNSVVQSQAKIAVAQQPQRVFVAQPQQSRQKYGSTASLQFNNHLGLGASVTVRNTQPLNINQLIPSYVGSPSVPVAVKKPALPNIRQQPVSQKHVAPPTVRPVPKSSPQQKPAAMIVQKLNPNLPNHPRDFYARGLGGRPWNESDDAEFKGQFQCEWCDANFPSNVSLSCHVLAHVLYQPFDDENEDEKARSSEKHLSSSLADASRCPICFAVFKSPFDMENHFQTVHGRQQKMEVQCQNPVCYICEKAFTTGSNLLLHLHNTHKEGTDAPYWCKICQFRTSFYDDMLYHFQKVHSGSRTLLCLMCLSMFDGQMPKVVHKKRTTVLNTKHFVAHMMQHVMHQTDLKMKCERCRLVFVKEGDKTKHQRTQHGKVNVDQRHHHGMKRVACMAYRPQFLHEEEKRPLVTRRLRRPVDRQLTLGESMCIECHQPMDTAKHYRGDQTACSVCMFRSNCSNSFMNHMIDHAKALEGNPTVFRKREVILKIPGHCACGFQTTFGNRLAFHLENCDESTGTAKIAPAVARAYSTDVQDAVGLPENQEQSAGPTGRFLKYTKLVSKKQNRNFDGEEDFDKEDEGAIQLKMQEILNRRRNRCQKFPMADSPDSGENEDSMINRPHLMSPKMHRSRQGSARITPKKPEREKSAARKRKRSSTESDSESDDSSSERIRAYKKRKLSEQQHESRDPFLSRRATVDQVGSEYRRYRDRAEKIELDFTGRQDQEELETSVGFSKKNGSTLNGEIFECAITKMQVASLIEDIIENVLADESLKISQPEEKAPETSDSPDSNFPPAEEKAPADPDSPVDYADFLRELEVDESALLAEDSADAEGNNPDVGAEHLIEEEENNLFARIEQELGALAQAAMDADV